MRTTKEALKKKNVELENELHDAVYALRAITRQAADREMLANAHDEPLVSRHVGSMTVTDFARGFLKDLDDKREREKKE